MRRIAVAFRPKLLDKFPKSGFFDYRR